MRLFSTSSTPCALRQSATRLLVFATVAALSIPAALRASPVAGRRGVVATAHPEASAAGLEMLRLGGTAADAAAAAAFVLAVTEPYSSGIGGGGFALVRMGQATRFLDFREVGPQGATEAMYMKDGKPEPALSRDGALAAAVPGAVAGYLELQTTYGKLSRDVVLAPAIRIAEEGFLVDERYRQYVEWRLDVLRADPEAARLFLVPGKKRGTYDIPPLGHRVVQPELASTLRAIAKDGARGFYAGKVGKALAADMARRKGLIGAADLEGYKVRWREPLWGSYRGHAIATAPLPSSGGVILLTVLNLLELEPAGAYRSVSRLHRYVEALKRAYADRALLGDPDFVPDVTAALVAKDRATRLAKTLGPRATPAEAIAAGEAAKLPAGVETHAGVREHKSMHTTHLSVVDAAGNAVAMTTTVNYAWGAGIVARGTGVLWNDEMDDFAIGVGIPNVYGVVGSKANAVAPGKVPLSSMTPTLVMTGEAKDGPLWLVAGSPGGPRIPTTVLQALVHSIDDHADVERAIAIGRLHHQHLPDHVFVEPFALEPATWKGLEARGHKLELEEHPWSNAMLIAIDPTTGVRTGAADPRGVGTALAE